MIRSTCFPARPARVLASLFLGATGLIGLASTALAQQGPAVASLLPEETLFSISVDDHSAYSKALEGMPLTAIMAEGEMKTFLEKPIGMMKQAIGTLQEKIREEEGFENFELSLDDLFAGSYGRIFLALTHFGLPDVEAGKMMPDIGLILGVEAKEGAPDWQMLIKDLMSRSAENAGIEIGFQPVTTDAYSYEELTGGKGERPPVVMGRVGNLQLFSISHESLRMVMNRASGSETGSLSASGRYQAGMKRLAIGDAGAVRAYVNIELGLRTLAEGIKYAMNMEGETEYLPLVDQLLDMSGLLAVKSLMSAGVSQNGVAVSKTFTGVEGERKGLLALQPAEPIDLSRLGAVPKDVNSLSMFQADVAGFYDFVMDVVKTVDEEAYGQVQGMMMGFGAQIAGEGNPPLDLRNDILANIGPQFMLVAPQSSNAMVPSFLFMADVREGDKVTGSLQSLLKFGSDMSGGQFSVKTAEYRETTIYQVDLDASMPVPVSPCFAVHGGQFIIALSVSDLKRHIRQSEKQEDSIRDNEDFQRFFSKVPKDGHLTSLSYTDIRYSVESMYGQLAMVVPMLTMAADFELPVDIALLPTQETITNHLYGALSFSMDGKNGTVYESYGPIGGEVLGLAIVGAAGVGAIVSVTSLEQRSERASSKAPDTATYSEEETPSDQVRYDLSNLKTGVTIYKLQQGSLPETLAQLLEPSEAYPQGCLGREDLPVDPWGNGYSYKTTASGYILWSLGPNGVDEGGQGDDIAVEKK
ncbi:MAG: type II secretion system protein GspG [Planctomycetota bacterium]